MILFLKLEKFQGKGKRCHGAIDTVVISDESGSMWGVSRSSGNIMSLPFPCLSSLSCPHSDHHPHANSKAGQNSDLKARSYLSLTSEFPVFHGSWGPEKPPESFGPGLSIKASSPSSLENSYLWKACPTQLPVGSGGRCMPKFFRPTGSFLSTWGPPGS